MNQIHALNEKLWKQIFIDHIFSDITWAINSNREIAAAQLLLAAIDVASGIERPADRTDSKNDIFIAWCENNMVLDGKKYSLTGKDLWGARCGFLHGYTPVSSTYRKGEAKLLAYVDQADDFVMVDDRSKDLVIVSLRALAESFRNALHKSIKRIKSDPELIALVNERLSMMFYNISLDKKFKNL